MPSVISIVAGILLIILIIYLISWMFRGSGKLTKLSSATRTQTLDGRSASTGNSSNYAYSIWFNVSDWNYRYGEKKTIFERGGKDGCISLSLGATENNLLIQTGLHSFGDDLQVESVNVERLQNIPLQRWVNVLVSVYGRTMDIYLDGKLTRSVVLPALPKTCGESEIKITPDGGFKGHTSSLQIWQHALNPQEAYDVYAGGFGGSLFGALFNKYRLKLSILDGNEEKGSVEI